MTKQSIDSYNKFAEEYATITEHKKIHTHYERPATWSLLPKKLEGLSILDAGCGSGWYAEQLLNAKAKVTAIDASEKMVALTKKRVGNQAECLCVSLENIATRFQPNSFDIIIAPLVIHYIKDWFKLFKDFSNLLCPNGLFIFSTHQPHTTFHMFNLENYFDEQLITDHWNQPKMTLQYYHHTLHTLSEALFEAHFVIERIVEPHLTLDEETKADPLLQKIQKQPWFLFVRAKKTSSASV